MGLFVVELQVIKKWTAAVLLVSSNSWLIPSLPLAVVFLLFFLFYCPSIPTPLSCPTAVDMFR